MAAELQNVQQAQAKECPSSLDYNTRMKTVLLNDHLNDFLQVDNIYNSKPEFPYIRQITDFTAVLPNLNKVKLPVRKSVLKSVVELEVQDALQKAGTLNWWNGTELLLLKTTSDGSCLLHATALYLWGTEDSQLQLRQYLYTVMKHDVYGQIIKRHWQYEKDQETYHLTPEQLDTEWSQVVEAGSCESKSAEQQGLPYEMLEPIHIFALSNILARPIIVLSDRNVLNLNGEAIQNDTLGGIYLPLLINPDEVFKSPILLVYNANHFMPLISQSSTRNGVPSDLHVPLVRKKLDPLKIHFLLPDQKQDELGCLKNYLWVKEELHTDDSDYCNKYLVAQLKFTKIDDSVDLLLEYVRAVRKWHTDNSPERAEISSLNKRCSTTGCTFYCTIDSDKFCSFCLRKFRTTDVLSVRQENDPVPAEVYENAPVSALISKKMRQNVIDKHVADLDDYLEPLVTSPSSATIESPYHTSKPPLCASEHAESEPQYRQRVAAKVEIGIPNDNISKYTPPVPDSTGIAQMTAQLSLNQTTEVSSGKPFSPVRGYGTPSPPRDEQLPTDRIRSPAREEVRSQEYVSRSSPSTHNVPATRDDDYVTRPPATQTVPATRADEYVTRSSPTAHTVTATRDDESVTRSSPTAHTVTGTRGDEYVSRSSPTTHTVPATRDDEYVTRSSTTHIVPVARYDDYVSRSSPTTRTVPALRGDEYVSRSSPTSRVVPPLRGDEYVSRSSPTTSSVPASRDVIKDESLSLRIEQRSEQRPTDLVRSFQDPLPHYKADRSFRAELCRYPKCDRYGDENLKKMCATHYRKMVNRMHMDKYSERGKGGSKYGYGSSVYSNIETTSAGSRFSGSSYSYSHTPEVYSSKYRTPTGLETSPYDRYSGLHRESPIDRITSIDTQSAIDRITAQERRNSPSASQHSFRDSRAILLDAEPDELRSLADVEAKIKQSAKFCKIEGCHNYGNIRKIGYCNECYDKRCKTRTSPP